MLQELFAEVCGSKYHEMALTSVGNALYGYPIGNDGCPVPEDKVELSDNVEVLETVVGAILIRRNGKGFKIVLAQDTWDGYVQLDNYDLYVATKDKLESEDDII